MPNMPNIPDFRALRQDLVSKAGDAVDLVPTPREAVDQVIATANELLALSKDVQNKVISALTSNA
jgi:hypothetical protein